MHLPILQMVTEQHLGTSVCSLTKSNGGTFEIEINSVLMSLVIAFIYSPPIRIGKNKDKIQWTKRSRQKQDVFHTTPQLTCESEWVMFFGRCYWLEPQWHNTCDQASLALWWGSETEVGQSKRRMRGVQMKRCPGYNLANRRAGPEYITPKRILQDHAGHTRHPTNVKCRLKFFALQGRPHREDN